MSTISFEAPGPYYENWDGKRATYTTSKSFEEVVKALRATVAPIPARLSSIVSHKPTAEEFEAYMNEAVKKTERPSGMFLFSEIPHSDWFRYYVPETPRAHKYIIGNPMVLKNMAMYDLASTLHAPWDFLLLEVHGQGTQIIFDLPSATMRSEAGGEGLDREAMKLEIKFKELVESWL